MAAPASSVPIRVSASLPQVHGRKPAAGRERPARGASRELVYDTIDWSPPEGQLGEAIYEPYALQSLRIADARPHPTALVQSAAMASVAPPQPDRKSTRLNSSH